jgi:AbiU2
MQDNLSIYYYEKRAMLAQVFKVNDSTEFDDLLRGLADDIVHAHIHYQLYRELHQSLCEHPLVTPQSNTLWQLTLNAHINTCMQSLCRGYDQDTKALHLRSWLLTIRENLHFFDQDEFRRRLKANPFVQSLARMPRKPNQTILEEDIRLCSPRDLLVKTLVIHRNSYVAHTDAKNIIAKRNPHDTYPLPFENFEGLLARAKAILNRYSSLFTSITYTTQIIGHDDYQFILKAAEEKIQGDEEEIKKTSWSPQAG